ncbi:MAG: hypothetical protein IPG92_19000 [Flavobacteriales bacterium]|nr:hypothetical protein [Flavobacteriales bacterium]
MLDGTDGRSAWRNSPSDRWTPSTRAVVFQNGLEVLTISALRVRWQHQPDQAPDFERILVRCDQNNTGNTDNNPQDVLIIDNTFLNGYEAIHLDA